MLEGGRGSDLFEMKNKCAKVCGHRLSLGILLAISVGALARVCRPTLITYQFLKTSQHEVEGVGADWPG